ncbi:MAG: hypothetical protein AB7E80_14340 [Hyphomicrobiaceae bacterium]
MAEDFAKALSDFERAMDGLMDARERLGRNIEQALQSAIENLDRMQVAVARAEDSRTAMPGLKSAVDARKVRRAA